MGITGSDMPEEYECLRCEVAENWQETNRQHFRYCCGGKGFDEYDWFQCTKCGWWGYIAEDAPAKHSLKFVPAEQHKFELLCKGYAKTFV